MAREARTVADPMLKVHRALERLRRADEGAAEARREVRRVMRAEIEAGRLTKAGIARELGVSRQRVQKMLEK